MRPDRDGRGDRHRSRPRIGRGVGRQFGKPALQNRWAIEVVERAGISRLDRVFESGGLDFGKDRAVPARISRYRRSPCRDACGSPPERVARRPENYFRRAQQVLRAYSPSIYGGRRVSRYAPNSTWEAGAHCGSDLCTTSITNGAHVSFSTESLNRHDRSRREFIARRTRLKIQATRASRSFRGAVQKAEVTRAIAARVALSLRHLFETDYRRNYRAGVNLCA